MSKIKFEVEIDSTNAAQITALQTFLGTLNGSIEPATQESNFKPTKARAKKEDKEVTEEEKPTEKTEEAPEKTEEAPEKTEEAPEKTEEAPVEKGTPTMAVVEVRALVSTKIKDNREDIKNKLSELGASSVTALSPDKYEEFVAFLNGLA